MRRLFTHLILAALLTGCLKPVKEIYPENPDHRNIPVYIVSHGWHAGIAIEANFIVDFLPKHAELPEANNLMFGWGDARYYSNPDAGFGVLTRAALLPTKSVVHIVGFDRNVERYFPSSKIVEVHITPEGARKLGEFIDKSLKVNGEHLIFYSNGLYQNSAFFEANRYYFLPRTSNRWTAKALRSTGYPISPFYAFTSGNVISQAKKDGREIQPN
ncbi:DUF2459 domain-containing protein [Rhodohalobacter halophilus]|uniref:DUF2459 domain-containing protein n=1 Tax=Rhodohalobacter halophilus TaxID=1812810 RepID=UPI00083F54AE|nr:DUF2459 domain-containing protein [Rhodohalobacter halophilus]